MLINSKYIACIVFAFFLVASPSYAQVYPAYARNFGNTCPGTSAFCSSVPLSPTKIFDFTTGALPFGITFTRASTAWYFNSSGLLVSAGVNTPRFDYATPGSSTLAGLLIESAVTNQVLYSRDFTQSVWVPTTMTTALDQTGIDGNANTASSLTATGANATICQTVTQAATAAAFSLYMKRISGAGTIQISQDGGSTYSTVAPTSSWQRFSHASQTTLNPGLCVKLATSGDEIAVDVAQFENNSGAFGYVSSPIITTSAKVIRSSDIMSASSSPWYNRLAGSYVYEWQQINYGGNVFTYAAFDVGYSVGVNNGNLQIPGTTHNCLTPAIGSTNKGGATYNSPAGVFKGAVNNVQCSTSGSIPSTNATKITFSKTWVRKFTYWNYPLTATQLQSLTQ